MKEKSLQTINIWSAIPPIELCHLGSPLSPLIYVYIYHICILPFMANDLSTGNYPSPIDQYFAGELHLYQYIYIYYIMYIYIILCVSLYIHNCCLSSQKQQR